MKKYSAYNLSSQLKDILKEDFERLHKEAIDWGILSGKTVLITGATGMLAAYITRYLIYLNETNKCNINIIALCRSREKAERLFGMYIDKNYFSLLLKDVCSEICISDNVDYIFHFAGNASPYHIVNDPVGICKSNLTGTFNVADFAVAKKVRNIVFASTREVYGKNENEEWLSETSFGTIDPLDDRSCYPESKRAAENILHSYFLQHGLHSNCVRIAHTYGPGMNLENDGRVMADFMCNIVKGEDIALQSSGEAERAFCYISDAVAALFLVLLHGEPDRAYNLSNETEQIKIRDLAELMASMEGNVHVTYKQADTQKGYCTYRRVGMDTTRIRELGWQPKVSLKEGIKRTFQSFR